MRHHRKERRAAVVAGVVALALLGFVGWRTVAAGRAAKIAGPAPKAVVYRSPTCGCCGNFVSYLKQKGFEVETKFVDAAERAALGVPDALGSCHTTVVGGYVVEGHVPVEAIGKLLKDKPAVKGIGMPGMPSGSPGMPGPKTGAFEISGFQADGTISPFMRL